MVQQYLMHKLKDGEIYTNDNDKDCWFPKLLSEISQTLQQWKMSKNSGVKIDSGSWH